MVERGKILYREKRKILGIKTRMFIPLGVIILIFIGVLFYYSIESGNIACFAPTIFISLVLIGIMAVLIMRLGDRFTIYENGIQFSDSAIGYVSFGDVRDIKYDVSKRTLANYIVVKRRGRKKSVTIAGNDFGSPWELTDNLEEIRDVLIGRWMKIRKRK
ncbi:MAG: hypothetical protein ACMUIG_09330 [Thermoplasmatota archaeon]